MIQQKISDVIALAKNLTDLMKTPTGQAMAREQAFSNEETALKARVQCLDELAILESRLERKQKRVEQIQEQIDCQLAAHRRLCDIQTPEQMTLSILHQRVATLRGDLHKVHGEEPINRAERLIRCALAEQARPAKKAFIIRDSNKPFRPSVNQPESELQKALEAVRDLSHCRLSPQAIALEVSKILDSVGLLPVPHDEADSVFNRIEHDKG